MHLGSVGVSRNGGRTAKGWNIAICMLLASVLGLCLMLWITPPVHADDSAGLGITATDDITDTQNLLGSNVSEITDAINQTKKETGVTVRLVYLDSFNAKGKPDKWVSALLESLNPKPNTVMLAVASNDGNLVVAVSSNSEEWLKKKSTVDALSDAAQKPLMESDPDWAKSATDMMNQISVQKKTSTSSRTIWIGVGGFAGALLLLVLQPGMITIIFALMLTEWVGMSRIARAEMLKLKDQEFVLASRTLGAGSFFIIFKEVLPNIIGPIITQVMFSIPTAIFTEAFLSFVGLGIPVPQCSLGSLISELYNSFTTHPYQIIPPIVVMSLLMLSFNLLADGLREALDPKMKSM
jgi:hypothetical protein